MSRLFRPVYRLALIAGLVIVAAIAYSAASFTPANQPFGWAPSLAITGFDLSTGNQKVFQTWFDPNVWRGEVVAYPVSTSGRTDPTQALWYASERIKLQDWDTGRRIVTRNGTANVAFRWANLSGAQQTSIGDATTGPKILNFVRGDRSNEKEFTEVSGDGTVTVISGSSTGIFRARASVLGDIIHGRPVFVGAPPADYLFDSYPTFKSNNSSRAGRVYVGANDGMVHAFDSSTGDEVFAYIPSMLIGGLKDLAVTPYAHKYFVDGGMVAGDANFGTTGTPDWRTVLVGGLGAGGKGLFALDVTSAAAADENAAKAKILWEITPASTGFGDLGFTYGDPQIVRLNTGKWAAIIGNGYNNSGTGHAVLYIIDIANGSLIKALDTGSGSSGSPNGLSSPTAIDINFDGNVDFVYAGDIDGNLWKFDIRTTDTSTWAAPSTPLYASGLSIIGAPDVATHPIRGLLVYFGTGRLFTAADAADATVQNYAYAIWDGAPTANTAILEQTLTEKTYGGNQRVRVSSALPINWNDASDPTNKPLHKGWRTALPPGERILGTGFVRDGRYHFSSVNPTKVNTTLPNGENWLMELDFLTGGSSDNLIFDLNSDSKLSDADRVSDTSGGAILGAGGVPIGVYEGPGLFSQPLLALVNASLSTTLFNSNPYVSPADTPQTPPSPNDRGVSGGHFDFDGYHGINMASFKHTHEYDDIYNVTGANFVNASDPIFNLGNTSVTGNRVTSTSRFFVLVSNGDLSPAVELTVGGIKSKAYQYPNKFDGTQTIYTPATVKLFQFEMPRDAFQSKDWGTGVVRAGLIPTVTGCVKNFPFTPGLEGEVHNGALTVWIVKEGAPSSVIALNVAGKPEKGYKVTDDSWVLKKYTVFWHHPNGKCYGQAGWVADPPQDTSPPDPKKWKTPAAGSEDPGLGAARATVTSTTTTFTPSSTNNGTSDKSGTRVTTTNYSNGSQVTVTETLDKKGKVTKTTTTFVPAPGGSSTAAGSSGTTAQGAAPPNTVAGYQQSRNSGKLGRVTWHELIKE